MPRIAPLLVLPAVVVSAACGSDDDGGADARGAYVGFPVTIERSGGVAGFQDRLVVRADGQVTVRTRAGASTCHVDEATLESLAALARSATGTVTATASHPDAMTVLLRGSDGVTVLPEGDLPGSAPVVARLLDDVGRPADERSICR